VTEEQEATYNILHAVGWELIPSDKDVKVRFYQDKKLCGEGFILKDGTVKVNYDLESMS